MALFKTRPTKFGATVVANYHRVESPSIIGKDTLAFVLASYAESPAENDEPFVRLSMTCEYKIDSSKNPFQQAYAHIKAQPEWAGAVDC